MLVAMVKCKERANSVYSAVRGQTCFGTAHQGAAGDRQGELPEK